MNFTNARRNLIHVKITAFKLEGFDTADPETIETRELLHTECNRLSPSRNIH